jgi:transcriptional regulator with XRE-family HTH domain
MITAVQLRAARALLSMDQQTLADLSGVSLATIQRMERSQGNVRGVIHTLTKVVGALTAAGVELLGDTVRSEGRGRGVRFKEPSFVVRRGSAARAFRSKKRRVLARS